MTNHPYDRPHELEEDALNDAMWDLIDNGTTTLHGSEDPDKWIYWLKRFAGFAEVRVINHTSTSLILEAF